MFKRANKITALLVAAASVMSIVPAMAADTTRIGNKQGTVKQGVAYADGKYSYYGFRTDDDHTGVYYNNGGDAKDTFTSDLEDYRLDTISKYGTKYAYAKENSNDDEYLVDLTTGKIVDDETAEQKAEASIVDLRASLKKAERYSAIKNYNGDINYFNQIAKGQFNDVWYKYVADGDKNITSASADNGVKAKAVITLPVGNFTVPGTKVFAGKTYKTAATAVTETKAKLKISNLPSASSTVGETNTFGGIKYTAKAAAFTDVDTASEKFYTIGDQPALEAKILASVKKDTTGVGSDFDASTATLSAGTITVQGKTAKEYTTSQNAAYVADVENKYGAGTATVIDGVPVLDVTYTTQDELNAAILADVKADTATFGTVFDASTATISTDKTTIIVSSAKGGEYLASQFTPATATVTAKYTTATTTNGAAGTDTSVTSPVQYIGFTDENGKYIDANYVANMYVFSTEKGRAVKIQKFGEENDDAKVQVDLVSLEAIDQDKDYIYAIAKVDVTGNGALEAEQYFLQKISKARGDQHDGAYLPKTVTSYELNINETYEDGDTKDAAKALLTSDFDGHDYLLGAQVVNGNTIYVTRAKLGTEDDNIKLWKLELKDSVKSDVVGTGNFLKKDVDAPLVKKTGDTDKDIEQIDVKGTIEDHGIEGIQNTGLSVNGNSIYRHPEVSFDVTGNTWVVNRGEIVKFDGTDEKTMFTCDRAMNAIDVYDDSNLIAWDMDGDAYTTVKEGTKVTSDEATVVAPVIVTGWVQDGANWSFNDTTGAKVTSKWINVGGNWYFLKADGVMATGWYNDNGTWYFLKASGAMATGWIQDGANWYYLNGSGAMLANTTVDGYVLGASGAWVK